MITNLPILYEHDDIVSFGHNNGIGVLSDAVECYVDETLNEEFELVLKYPTGGSLFNELITGRIIYAKPSPNRDAEPFRIYRFGKVIRDSVEFSARHISYDLIGIILKPSSTNYYQPKSFFGYLNNGNNYYTDNSGYTFYTDLYDDYDSSKVYNIGDYVMHSHESGGNPRIHKCKENNVTGAWNSSKWDYIDNKISINKPEAVRSIFGTGDNTILGAYGGEFKYEYDKTTQTKYVKLLQSRGSDRGVSLRYGINLMDLNQEKNISEMYTGVLPFYKSGDTLVTGSPVILYLSASEQTYEKILPLDVTGDFTGTPTNQQVSSMGRKYIAINEYNKPKVSIDIKQPEITSFDFSGGEIIELGDFIQVYYEKLGISTKAKIVSTSYDVLTGKYREIQIGDVKNTIVRTIAQQTTKVNTIVNNYYEGGGGSGGPAFAVFG